MHLTQPGPNDPGAPDIRRLKRRYHNRAPLYHGTDFAAAFEALNQDCLLPLTRHAIEGLWVNGTSTSRSFEYAYWWSQQESPDPVVLILDREKIASRHRIISHDIFGDADSLFPERRRSESEEFILGPIRNLSLYLLDIAAVSKDPTGSIRIDTSPILFQKASEA